MLISCFRSETVRFRYKTKTQGEGTKDCSLVQTTRKGKRPRITGTKKNVLMGRLSPRLFRIIIVTKCILTVK